MARWERGFRTSSSPVGDFLRLAPWAALLAWGSASAQAPLRCDLKLESTPGAPAGAACLDLVAMQNGGAPIVTANNVTRISVDGFTLCKNAFQVTQPAGADIIFIYDNSGSMWAHYAKIDSAKNDTSYYHAQSCGGGGGGGGGLTGTPLTYTTLIGPRTVQLLPSATTCTEYAGDPYFARGKAIAQAIDYLAANSPQSTAGAIAFERDTNHTQKPLLLSVPGNADIVKASLKLDSVPSTTYVPPLRLATTWLTDTAITNTSKKAIVFLSDGQPNDGTQLTTWLASNTGIPIYTIALGDSAASFTRMEDMSTRTGGRFYRVAPENIAGMNQVMQEIVKSITVVDMPTSIQVTNNTFTPPMVSKSVRLARGADSSIVPVMDSIVALKTGLNSLTVKVTLSENEVRSYTVKVQADGPAAAATSQSMTCFPQPVLTLLNQAGGVDSAYTAANTPYNVRLTRATSDLQQVIVVATSSDTTRPGWGDEESLNLPQTSASAGTTVNQKNNVMLEGSAPAATKGDGRLQAAPGPGGSVTLTWKHPRDEREKATFRLPGKSIGTASGFIDVVRATDAPHGAPLPATVTDPIVIRGGVTLVQTATGATLKHKGDLSNPHKLGDDILDPNRTPTFVFNTASPFSYTISVYDHLGQFLNSKSGAVDSAAWDKMRAGADSLACAFSVLPISKDGQLFGTGVYILRATLTTRATVRQDQGKPIRVTPATKIFTNRFGFVR
jgi:hypothetical protein